MIRAVIYCRCSTEEECQRDALVRQAAEARECVRRLNWFLADEYIESRSGTSVRGREQYQRLFEDLLGKRFDVVVIKSQDRLMRNTKRLVHFYRPAGILQEKAVSVPGTAVLHGR